MGLFDKKYCDICGEKISLLGNRKLEDGNCCKDCAKKLSPFFSERKQSTVADIKAQLAYREENAKKLSSFQPTRNFGDFTKIYIDDNAGIFIVTSSTDWKSKNPDIISLSQVVSCDVNVRENKTELYYRDTDGNRKSYFPPRYEYSYIFFVIIHVNSPWFSNIEIELNPSYRPDSRYSELYRQYEIMGNNICSALKSPAPRGGNVAQTAQFSQNAYSAAPAGAAFTQGSMNQQPAANASWFCQSCGTNNSSGKFCQSCGAQRPASGYRCDKCGWTPAPGQSVPRFCPNCGDPFDQNDMV